MIKSRLAVSNSSNVLGGGSPFGNLITNALATSTGSLKSNVGSILVHAREVTIPWVWSVYFTVSKALPQSKQAWHDGWGLDSGLGFPLEGHCWGLVQAPVVCLRCKCHFSITLRMQGTALEHTTWIASWHLMNASLSKPDILVRLILWPCRCMSVAYLKNGRRHWKEAEKKDTLHKYVNKNMLDCYI